MQIVGILGAILFTTGIVTIVAPVKVAVKPQNERRIAAGLEPMNEEEFAIAVKKARRRGVLIAVVGVVMYLLSLNFLTLYSR